MTFWETVLSTGLGAAAGAFAAFAFNLVVERKKRAHDNLTAGHVALAILRSKLLYIQMVVKAWEKSQTNPGPGWWQFPSPASFPTDPRRIDLTALGFLLRRSRSGLVSDVVDAEVIYFDFMAVFDAYRDFCLQSLHPAMSTAGFPSGLSGAQAAEWERRLPDLVLARVRDLHGQLEIRVETAPRLIRKAAGDLVLALREAFPNETFESPDPSGRIAAANT